jgi:hypothetical protein
VGDRARRDLRVDVRRRAAPHRVDHDGMRRMHKQYGFDASFYEDSYGVDERIGGWLADRSFFAQTVTRLHDLPRPFFTFLLTSSNHHPYKGDGLRAG